MKQDNTKTPPDKTETMFEFWYRNSRNFVTTSKEYGIARTTLHRIAKREGWNKRADKLKSNIEKDTEKKIRKDTKSNLEYVRAVKKKLLLTILEKPQLEGTLSELIKLMEYEDRLMGLLPDENKQPVNYILNIINGLSAEQQQQLDRNLVSFFGENGGIPQGERELAGSLGSLLPPDGQEPDAQV